MAALPGIGFIQYNGVTFGDALVNSRISITPVRGDDDRATSYYNVQIDVVATLDTGNCGLNPVTLASGELNYLLLTEKLRAMLSQDGAPLIYRDKLFRNFEVNTASGLTEVNHGPRVKMASFVPILGNKAIELTWSVVAAVGECPATDGSGNQTGAFVRSWSVGDIKQAVYGVDWESDHRGYTTRTVKGFIEIVQSALTDGALLITADDYRERLTVSSPPGFMRTRNQWSLNERRDRISFMITDQEIPSANAWPPGVVAIDVKHRVSIGNSSSWVQAMSTLSGSCEVANPLPISAAWERLYPIIDGRINAARAATGGIFLTNIEVTEHLFTRKIDFTISYYKLSASPYGFLKSSGMFSPATTTSTWADWQATMYGPDPDTNGTEYTSEDGLSGIPLPWARRSVANLSFEPSDDQVITACSQQPLAVTIHNNRFVPFPNDLRSALANVCPLKTASYLLYRSSLESSIDGRAQFFQEMPTSSTSAPIEVPKPPSGESAISAAMVDDTQTGRVIDSSKSSPLLEFRLVGKAARVGFPVELPSVMSVWGTAVQKVPNGQRIKSSSLSMMGCRIYFSSWDIKYRVAKKLVDAASDLGTLSDTLFGTGDFPAGDVSDIA